jgi:hypothetical protein
MIHRPTVAFFPRELREVGGVEALAGILRCGLSTGMLLAVSSEIPGMSRKILAHPHQTATDRIA